MIARTMRANRQLMIIMKKTAVAMFITPQVMSSKPPGHQFGNAIRVRGHPGHDPANRRPVKVGEGKILEVVEHALPQIVADPFTQHAGQVDEAKDSYGLDHDERPIPDDNVDEDLCVASDNALIYNPLAEVGKVGIQRRHQRNSNHKADEPLPVGLS